MATVLDLITRSLRLAGVVADGEALTASQSNTALVALNSLLDEFLTQEGLSWSVSPVSVALTIGKQSYTVGTGLDISMPRPLDIAQATISLGTTANPLDYPLEILSDEGWAAISLKKMQTTIPRALYYSPDYPAGTVYLWPTPSGPATLNLWTRSQVTQFANTSATVALPPGWANMLTYGLAAAIAPEYGFEVPGTVAALYRAAVANVKRSNHRNRVLGCDAAVLGKPALGSGLAGFLAGR